MQNNHSFTVYNASAGSGKTYTLVKEYLKIVLSSNNQFIFKNILAITFTNKAVAEMKDRIVDTLKAFSKESVLKGSNDMFESISKELDIEPMVLHKKSEKLLNTILHNYASFDISTIDGFTHKLIRTFAHDLKLPINFEVELDQDSLLNEAVDSLINKAGSDAELTKVIVDFAIEKADDDKSWDITFDFNKIAKLLVNENDIPYFKTLKDKTLEDFKNLKAQLRKDIFNTEKTVADKAQDVLTLIDEAGLAFNDFSSSYLPKHFQKITKRDFNLNFNAKWQEDIETKTLYPKKVTIDVAYTIEQIQPTIASAFNETKKEVFQYKFLKGIYKNMTPLSVLNVINNELNILKADQNKMLISEFNSIISNEIKNQPTPFIYERIGEKFNHYFIDEFQDTSKNQWHNLIPLLENPLSTDPGSLMIVGDAKQAIYRWRGGKAEQFIDLFNKKSTPFPVEQQVENLPKNYRSLKAIVNFNNAFFEFISEQVFSNPDYKTLYKNAHQDITKKEEGYVELSFLTIENDDDKDELYSSEVLKAITNCLQNGYKLSDICILVRKGKEGIAVANYLNEQDIPVISSDSLLISNSPEVTFVNHLLTLLIQPKNEEVKMAVLSYLTTLFNIKDKHSFFTNHIHLSISELFKSLESHDIFINRDTLLQLSLYDLTETIFRDFNLLKKANAYIQFYLDIILDFTEKKGSDISEFLAYFDKKKDNLSIVSPVGQNAIQIMTIHKSKGLEFPVVIFPYADLNIYKEIEPKEWFPLDEKQFNGFSKALINYNEDFKNYGEDGQVIYDKHKSELELDAINLLYVVLTRAVEQLYIISKNDDKLKEDAKLKKYSGLLINYLKEKGLWNDAQSTYTFGTPNKTTQKSTTSFETSFQNEFISTSRDSHNIKIVTKSAFLWDTNQKTAIERGNLIHDIMAQIVIESDADKVIQNFIENSIINEEQAAVLKQTVIQIINHPELKEYFNSNYEVYNERDIITKDGTVIRPDRLLINNKLEAVIIDYKTGTENKTHHQQLQLYQDILDEMKFIVIKKILVYIDENIKVKLV